MPIASRPKRNLPFLQRNWARGFDSSQTMGNAVSSPSKVAGNKLHESVSPDLDGRPQKRRRVGSTVATGRRPASGVVAKDHSLVDQLFVAHEVGSIQRTLRVDVLKIVHKDLAKLKIGSGLNDSTAGSCTVQETKARCKIMLTHGGTKVDGSDDVVLHCQSQMCTIKAFQSPAGPFPMARIYLTRSFHIPEDSILINRTDNHLFDLADSYKITVELEAVGPGAWPPLGFLPLSEPGLPSPGASSRTRTWVLAGEVAHIFGRSRSMIPLKLRKSHSQTLPTDYLIDVDARWSTGYEASAIRPLEKGVEPSIIVEGMTSPGRKQAAQEDVQEDAVTRNAVARNSVARTSVARTSVEQPNGHVNGDNRDDDEDQQQDGELTPNRSLRTREAKNYNLKLLSDRAQGKERARRKRKNVDVTENGRISYDLPAEQVHLSSFRCVTCGNSHASLKLLQAHLEWRHPEYEYVAQSTTKGIHFQVSHRGDAAAFDPRTYEFTMPTKAFGLYSSGDGEDGTGSGNRVLPKPSDDSDLVRNGRSKSRSVPTLRSAEAEEASPQHPVPKSVPEPKKILIPKTSQPLYDPLSRAPLEPGTVFRRLKPDDRWLVQWHREAIEDFSDIPPEEREFMTTWDEFMLTQRIATDAFLPSSWLEFVKLKADWLVRSASRMTEFGKHLSYLLMRDVLNDKTIKEAFQVIASARARLKQQEYDGQPTASPGQSPKEHQQRKSAANCQVCNQQVLGPRLLVCSNSSCKRRIYHSNCIQEAAKMDVHEDDWVCNTCIDIPPAERT
ncbi:hypothetical protein ACRALDRAFT_1082662 [Sodiomyces alcalophilus JCM 7366]|uniref:uncharacterized protein n=1 Tax=Sodiomyces alcalophilus JCM 7366 TaxID=591952 RepID=UPI0039B57A6B